MIKVLLLCNSVSADVIKVLLLCNSVSVGVIEVLEQCFSRCDKGIVTVFQWV